MMISAVAAMSLNRVIGKDNQLPWHIPEDLKFFKTQTSGKIMILGRKTFESIGKPLPKRFHIVITRNADYKYDHPAVKVVGSVKEAVDLAKSMSQSQAAASGGVSPATGTTTATYDASEIIVAGGGEIYTQSLPFMDRIYLTVIDQEVDGDAYFPEFDLNQFKLVKRDDRTEPVSFSFRVYDRYDRQAAKPL